MSDFYWSVCFLSVIFLCFGRLYFRNEKLRKDNARFFDECQRLVKENHELFKENCRLRSKTKIPRIVETAL